ncbi:hypothetical protein FA13DRAFT_1713114 [Coprinellus micaceus]|uniref:Uncharacterized protein n=1 Tax=Coprinellus micaceus TaxID=71717 RepID=A0A4Y7SY55_COPMI|nr:hypothetical protein FA13DRAFT_1713114 [Coprinellus micaceus]
MDTNPDLALGEGVKDEIENSLNYQARRDTQIINSCFPPRRMESFVSLQASRMLASSPTEAMMVQGHLGTHGSLLLKRSYYPDLDDTEEPEWKSRAEGKRKAKHKHVEQIGIICTHWHGHGVVVANRGAQDHISHLGRASLMSTACRWKEED